MAVLDKLGRWPEDTWFQRRFALVRAVGPEKAAAIIKFREKFIFDPEPVKEGDIWQKKQEK